MNIDKPTLNLYCEKRRVLQTGENTGKAHIKLTVTFIERVNGKKAWRPRHYKTGIFCKPADFPKVIDWDNNRVATHIFDVRAALLEIRRKAEGIVQHVTNQIQFEAHFLSGLAVDAIEGHFNEKILQLKARNKISSKEKYTSALHSLTTYFGYGVTFSMLSSERLQDYEDWYISQPRFKTNPKIKRKSPPPPTLKSLTTVGINMRCLRHIFNRVIKKGIIPSNLYPFADNDDDGYVIPEGGKETKQFLNQKDKAAFVNWRSTDDRLNELHDYALFSYYGFGMNLADVARLKKSRVFKEHIELVRQKTAKRKKKKTKVTAIPIHPVMLEIMKRRQKKSLIPGDYVFPILDYNMDEESIFYRIRQLVDDVNNVLRIISEAHKFEIRPTSYTLRHTFSFNFMQMGGSTEELQDALSHGSIKTTESYKHGFEFDKKKKFSEGL